MEPAAGPPKSCRRHRRNSDVFAENCQHNHLSEDGNSDEDDGEPPSSGSSVQPDMVSDCEDMRQRARTEPATTPSRARKPYAAIGHSESPPIRHGGHRLNTPRHHRHRTQGLSRNRTVYACHTGDKDIHAADIQETIDGNTHDEPMSSMKALRLFDTVFAAGPRHPLHGDGASLLPEHDPSCKHCVSEAMVTAHQAAAKGIQHGSHGELRMNLGDGRNAVYVAPCEQHLECPLEKKGKYLIHTNKPKIMTDMSKVEFGICVDGWKRLVFKTVNDPDLAKRELSFYRKVATSSSDHLMHLLDDFTDNFSRHVMVFPRKVNASIYGHELFDIAYIARQLFAALQDLHELGIAHLDITPTNLVSDTNDRSHIEVIDFGLACDISEAPGGRLPSRGTCGFVAPEVLTGGAKDLRADVYSAGVVLGMMLQRYLPTINLRLLGGPLVRSDTTDAIVAQLDELLEAYQYRPGQTDFIECNTTYVAPPSSHPPAVPTPKVTPAPSSCPSTATSTTLAASVTREPMVARRPPARPEVFYSNKRNHSDDDEANALAAVYVGGASILGSYGNLSDDDDNDSATTGHSRFSGYNMIYGRTHGSSASATATNSGNGRSEHGGSRYSPSRAFSGEELSADDRDYFGHGGRFYSSPRNTPTSFMRDDFSTLGRRPFGLASHVSTIPVHHSSARYATESASHRRNSTSRIPTIHITSAQPEDPKASAVGKPGRVPLAVLHAADLLRWTLQPQPQWRPTATQALAHPFLAPIEVKRWRSRPTYTAADNRASSRADSGIAADRSASGSRQSPMLDTPPLHGEAACLLCAGSCEPEEQPGNLHTCVHGDYGSGVVSQCNSKPASPVIVASPAPGPELSSALEPARRDSGMFKHSALGDIRQWEGEMHQRVSHSSHGERMDLDSNHSYDHTRDTMSSFYSSARDDEDDITSYFF
ncbi:hypothetical protein LPJ70_000652 [Coemansia sp. RSA 2708]|nr:hypothetical protein LPJ70_000652 [Coemansia sp. RSA 2708]KAJ2308435.1 hypothetical protein IWW54_004075 [Coemansia sp. RSA 2705]